MGKAKPAEKGNIFNGLVTCRRLQVSLGLCVSPSHTYTHRTLANALLNFMDQRFTHPGDINPQLPSSLSWYTVNVYVVPKMVIYQFTPPPRRLVTGWYLLHGNVTPLRRVPHSPIHSNNWKRTMF